MTIAVLGIGWLMKNEYGCIVKGERASYENADSLAKRGLFAYPVKNFGRFDRASRMTCFGVALALRDAGIAYSAAGKLDIGIVATSDEGSLPSDIEYFRDYLDSGRTLSRGNLFIYTLPSSPAGEAAIHFGLLGPVLFTGGPDGLAAALDTAADLVSDNAAGMMIAGKAADNEAIFFVAGKGSGTAPALDVKDAKTVISASAAIAEMVRKFSFQEARKARV